MELIKIFNNNGQNAVSARELHKFLGSKRDFSNWIKDRIEKYGFIENQDFEVFNKFGENPNGGRPLHEYALSIDCAKEISMVEGNENGKKARQYFIECEKKLKSDTALDFSNPDTVLLLAQNWKNEQVKRIEAERINEVNRPKVIFADAVSASKTSILIGELAKLLKQNGIEIGQNRLFNYLREKGFLISRKGSDFNMPTQRSMELDLFEIKETSITHSDGHISISKTPKVTGKGQQYFINKFLNKQLALK